MHCRCGNTLQNVPEHLIGLAEFTCRRCTKRTMFAQSMAIAKRAHKEDTNKPGRGETITIMPKVEHDVSQILWPNRRKL